MSRHETDFEGQELAKRDKLLRIKLVADIEKFERQLRELKTAGNSVNFADIQALKELISTRQEMLKRINF
jgi:hypothetical protein